MRIRRPILLAIVLTISSLGLASGVSARTPVDPTSLTPPLKPFRVCWQLGPYAVSNSPPIVIPAAGVTPESVPDWAASWQRLAP
jgi:hypothetical protein